MLITLPSGVRNFYIDKFLNTKDSDQIKVVEILKDNQISNEFKFYCISRCGVYAKSLNVKIAMLWLKQIRHLASEKAEVALCIFEKYIESNFTNIALHTEARKISQKEHIHIYDSYFDFDKERYEVDVAFVIHEIIRMKISLMELQKWINNIQLAYDISIDIYQQQQQMIEVALKEIKNYVQIVTP